MYNKIHILISKSVDILSTLFHVDRKFIKFLFVGGINTLFAYIMYSIFITTPLPRPIALLCAYIVGVLWNFKTTGTLVFKSNDNSLIFKFFGVYILTYFINLIALNLLADIGVNKYLAQLIVVPPVSVLTFILFKLFVFKENNNDNNEI